MSTYEENLFSNLETVGELVNDKEIEYTLKEANKPGYCYDGGFGIATEKAIELAVEKGEIEKGDKFKIMYDVLSNEEGQLGYSADVEKVEELIYNSYEGLVTK